MKANLKIGKIRQVPRLNDGLHPQAAVGRSKNFSAVAQFGMVCAFQEKLEILRQNPHGHPQLDIKPMQGAGESVYRLRVGQYRLIYQIYEGEMIIFLMTAGSRGGVYK